MTMDKKVKEVRTLPCGESGFCLFTEKKTRKIHEMTLTHCDTLMGRKWDTTMVLPAEWQRQAVFFENGAVVMFYRLMQKSRQTDKAVMLIYHPDKLSLEEKEISGIPVGAAITGWHHYQGNFIFTSLEKNGDMVWYLPAGSSSPYPFTFTRETPGVVLTTAVDTARGRAVICFASGSRTMYFETDFLGQSHFANILNEPATQAQWVSVGRNHAVLMLYYEDRETFYIHPINILCQKVSPSETIYCADVAAPKQLPKGVKEKRTIIVAPYSYVSFYPTYCQVNDGRIACITELYYPEYNPYFNGWYMEQRFNGYRYERADVHFFDTNGVFQTNLIFPYNDVQSLHTTIIKKLRVNALPENRTLLYFMDAYNFSTMLLDSNLKVIDPLRTTEIPLRGVSYRKRNTSMESLQPWYGQNKFLISAYKVLPSSQQRTEFIINKLEYR